LKELVAGRRSPSTPVQPFRPPALPAFRRLHRFRRASRRTDGLTQPAVNRTSGNPRTAPPASAEGFGEARRSALGARRRRKPDRRSFASASRSPLTGATCTSALLRVVGKASSRSERFHATCRESAHPTGAN
jgi:hypothetical protein